MSRYTVFAKVLLRQELCKLEEQAAERGEEREDNRRLRELKRPFYLQWVGDK